MTKSAWKIMTGICILLVCLVMLGGCDQRHIREHPETAQVADKLHTEGLMLFAEERYDEALDAWMREINLDPKRPRPYNNIGIVYRKLGEPRKAMQYHKRAIAADPHFGHSYYSFGLVHFDMRDYRTAVDMFLKAIKNNFDNADVFYSLGQSYKSLKEFSSALEAYESAVKRYFTYPGVHYQIGVIHALQGNVDLARVELKRELSFNSNFQMLAMLKLLEIDATQFPENTDILFRLGKFYADEGDDEKASETFRRLLTINPEHFEASRLLGEISDRRGGLSDADDDCEFSPCAYDSSIEKELDTSCDNCQENNKGTDEH